LRSLYYIHFTTAYNHYHSYVVSFLTYLIPINNFSRNPIPPINNALRPPPVSKRISMADYKKIQKIIDDTIKVRARRYNYDLVSFLLKTTMFTSI
jgi:hypothetical protein